MKTYALIGRTLEHSWSEQYFQDKFETEGIDDCRYLSLPSGDMVDDYLSFQRWLNNNIIEHHLDGFNVTTPYKEWACEFVDEADCEATEIGAVNVVKVYWTANTNFRTKGFNTDAPAFAATLAPILTTKSKEALILGTGGAAKAVAHALKKMDFATTFVSRTKLNTDIIGYSEAVERAKEVELIVNATPVGMYPNEAKTPWIDTHTLSPHNICYDLIYNPPETLFLLQAELAGASTKNGLEMLHLQANLSWQIWIDAC